MPFKNPVASLQHVQAPKVWDVNKGGKSYTSHLLRNIWIDKEPYIFLNPKFRSMYMLVEVN